MCAADAASAGRASDLLPTRGLVGQLSCFELHLTQHLGHLLLVDAAVGRDHVLTAFVHVQPTFFRGDRAEGRKRGREEVGEENVNEDVKMNMNKKL